MELRSKHELSDSTLRIANSNMDQLAMPITFQLGDLQPVYLVPNLDPSLMAGLVFMTVWFQEVLPEAHSCSFAK